MTRQERLEWMEPRSERGAQDGANDQSHAVDEADAQEAWYEQMNESRRRVGTTNIGMEAASSSSPDASSAADAAKDVPLGEKRREPTNYPEGVEIVTAAEAQANDQGFRPKRRRAEEVAADHMTRLPPWRLASRMDFVIENPWMGVLWQSAAIELLKGRNSQRDGLLTKHTPTSYCHYGYEYQKPTNFFTSLVNLELKPPCPQQKCAWLLGDNKRHRKEVAECASSEANSIPERIVHACLDAWVAKLAAGGVQYDHLVVVDAFTGFGSVETHAKSWARDNLSVASVTANDIVKKRDGYYNLDMGTPGNLAMLIQYARLALRATLSAEAREDLVRDDNVAVLLWLSTPCNTYGPQGRSSHRITGQPIDEAAQRADAMNLLLAQWLYDNLLTPPQPPPAPPDAP